MNVLAPALALALLTLPVTAAAQVSPTAPVHPSMPWSGISTPQGQLIRFIYVPPRPVILEYIVPAAVESPAPAAEPAPPAAQPPPPTAEPGPPTAEARDRDGDKASEQAPPSESPPAGPQIVRQQITVPGYYVRETTVGFHYPERWSIEQAAPNLYRWRQLPAQFVPK